MNQRFLSAMLDMGIPSEKAELALSETGNVGVEARSLSPSPCNQIEVYSKETVGNQFTLFGHP